VRSRGKERPVCTEDTEACQSQNRRVVLIVPAL
jgi:outer membrane protein OmpA-like peptidoglycan-associated protein